AGAERAVVTAQDADTGIRVCFECTKGGLQLQGGGMIDRVAHLRAVHDDRGDGSVFFNSYWHRRPQKCVRASTGSARTVPVTLSLSKGECRMGQKHHFSMAIRQRPSAS